MKLFSRKYELSFIALLLTLLLDQFSKCLATAIQLSDPTINRYHIISVFEKIYTTAGFHFFLIHVRHYFEMYQLLLRVVVLPVIGMYIIYYVLKHNIKTRWVFLGFGILIGALIGNAADILYRGYVIDWIGCSFFVDQAELNYAINFADIAAVVSAPLILIGLRKSRTKTRQNNSVLVVPVAEESLV